MGLRAQDLKDLVKKTFEVDSYASKMGEDDSIITLSFSLYDKSAAEDLVGFFEKGYQFVLDADATPGEQSDGTYKVFVEIERDSDAAENIHSLLDGLDKLTNVEEFRFRYYKSFRSKPATLENLEQTVPTDSDRYGIIVSENRLNNYTDFFNKGFVDTVYMNENTLHIAKKWADPLAFEFIEFGDAETVKESQEGAFDIVNAYPEIMYLTKYVGDYAVSKYGKNIVLENEDKALVLRRLQ
jgi:hypothetical protein